MNPICICRFYATYLRDVVRTSASCHHQDGDSQHGVYNKLGLASRVQLAREVVATLLKNGPMKFSTTLFQMGNNTGIEVPEEVLTALGAGKRPAVVVNVNGFEYRSTVAVMGGKYLLPFSAERRRESGIAGGDAIEVELTSTPRRGRSRSPRICRRHWTLRRGPWRRGRSWRPAPARLTSRRCSAPRQRRPGPAASRASSPSWAGEFRVGAHRAGVLLRRSSIVDACETQAPQLIPLGEAALPRLTPSDVAAAP